MHIAEPVDAIRTFHNAFMNDLKHIDTASFDAAKGEENSPCFEIFNVDFLPGAYLDLFLIENATNQNVRMLLRQG